jgi:hypothetical protein
MNMAANDIALARVLSEWNSPRYAYDVAALPDTLEIHSMN